MNMAVDCVVRAFCSLAMPNPTPSLIEFATHLVYPSLVPRPRPPPGEKRSGEQSRIPWAYSPKVVMTNEIARSVIIT